tara:strand:+ start:736 stop:1068 length:333 start_codon:yes stop_codon:yes gene_type:complete
MDVGLVAVLVALLSVPIASLFTWTLNKKKDSAQIANLYSEAGQSAVETLSTALDVIREQLNEVQKDNIVLRSSLEELKGQNKILIEENKKLIAQMKELKLSYEQSQLRDN